MKKIALLGIITLFATTAFAQGQSTQIDGLTARETRKLARASTRDAVKGNSLASVCGKISNLSGLLVKVTAGGHIPRSDPRYSGFSIICAGRCAPFPASVYHCNGSLAFKMGYYGRWDGNGKSRGYCGWRTPQCPTGSVRSRNKSLKCSGAAYLNVGGKSCMRFNINSSRNGGV